MKLTIEELSKRTKLSIPTLRVYVSRQKLGTKVGNNRYFSQADVDKLLKGSKKSGRKAAKGSKSRKVAPSRKPAKAKSARAKAVRKVPVSVKAPTPKVERPEPKPQTVKRSFWSRLFGGPKKPQKIALMQAKKS